MALTRAMLKGMNLTEEQVGAIIDEHVAVTTTLKNQIADRDAENETLKEKVKNLSNVEKELKELKQSVTDGDWENKYTKEHDEFEKFKADISAKETMNNIKKAYKKLLSDCKVGDKHHESILRVTDFSNIKLKEDGTFENADDLKKQIESDWNGFISTEGTKGADVDTPPASGGNENKGELRAAKIAAKYNEERYGKIKEG